jgi:fucose permease
MAGVTSLGWLIKRGYRHALVCGFSLIAGGVAGLNLGSYVASLAAAALFGCGLGQVLSATNLWVAEVAKARRVAALSILKLMWGMGAIASSPLGMLAGRRGATALLLCAVAIGALLTALILAGMNLQPGTTEDDGQPGPTRSENISTRSTVSLAALFFPYVGSESSVAGWVASLTKRTNPDSGDLWALAPMFFWGALFAGRALVPLVPLRRRERTMLASGLIVAAAGICLLLEARTFASVAICVTAAGLGLAAIYPILVAWLVKAFGERSRRIGAVMFALAGMGGATMPWLVGLRSTRTGSLRAGLLVPLAGCVAMFALLARCSSPFFEGQASRNNSLYSRLALKMSWTNHFQTKVVAEFAFHGTGAVIFRSRQFDRASSSRVGHDEQPVGRLVPVKDKRIDALGHFSYGNHRYFRQCICINSGHRSRGRVGNIDNFAVGRKGDPLRHRTGWGMTERIHFGQGSIAD